MEAEAQSGIIQSLQANAVNRLSHCLPYPFYATTRSHPTTFLLFDIDYTSKNFQFPRKITCSQSSDTGNKA
jgi:hypothetical protein